VDRRTAAFDVALARTEFVSNKGYGGKILKSSQISWLPFLDTYRTLCVVPPPDFRRLLEGIREMQFAA